MNPNLQAPSHQIRDKNDLTVTHPIPEACFILDRVGVLSPHPGRIVRMISVPLDRPREQSMTETKPSIRICARAREALGSGEPEEDASIKD